MKKNIKGMTLIEVIVSLLIVSTASLIMVQGFVTTNRLFYQANQYNEITNKVKAALIPNEKGEINSTQSIKVKQETKETITFYKNTDQEIVLQGSVYSATSNQFSDNQLIKFIGDPTLESVAPDQSNLEVASKLYKSYCRMMEEIKSFLYAKGYWVSTNNIKDIKSYVKEYLLQYTNEVQLKKLGIDNNTSLSEKLGEIYAARYFFNKVEMPSITEDTAKKLAIQNNNIYNDKKGVYPGTNGENYCYPTLIPTYTEDFSVNELFNENKYKNYIFIALNNHSNVQIPNVIQAIYNINSENEWYVFLKNNKGNIMSTNDFIGQYPTFLNFINNYSTLTWNKIQAEK